MKVKFSHHALDKLELLNEHGFSVTSGELKKFVLNPDKIERGYKNRYIAQVKWNDNHVIRIVYEEHKNEKIIITFYPGRRDRYEKN